MSRRAAKKDLTRSQILSASAYLFAEQGYEQTSIDEIAKKADIAKGTFYYHFDSKEAVVVALRTDSFADSFDTAMQALKSGSSPIRIMEQVFMERAAWTEKNPELTKVFFEQRIHQFVFRENDVYAFPKANAYSHKTVRTQELHEHQLSKYKENSPEAPNGSNGNGSTNRMRLFAVILELVTAAQKKREIRQDIDASELTQIIIATFIHAQGSWLGGYSGTSLIDKVHRWFHAILDGLYDQSMQIE